MARIFGSFQPILGTHTGDPPPTNQSPKYPTNLPNRKKEDREVSISTWLKVGAPCKPLAKGSLSSYQTEDLDHIPDELVPIWERLTAYPSFYQEVERAIALSNTFDGGTSQGSSKTALGVGGCANQSVCDKRMEKVSRAPKSPNRPNL